MQSKTDAMQDDRVRLNIWVSGRMHKALLYLASLDNRTISDLIRESMRDYLEKYEDRLIEEAKDG